MIYEVCRFSRKTDLTIRETYSEIEKDLHENKLQHFLRTSARSESECWGDFCARFCRESRRRSSYSLASSATHARAESVLLRKIHAGARDFIRHACICISKGREGKFFGTSGDYARVYICNLRRLMFRMLRRNSRVNIHKTCAYLLHGAVYSLTLRLLTYTRLRSVKVHRRGHCSIAEKQPSFTSWKSAFSEGILVSRKFIRRESEKKGKRRQAKYKRINNTEFWIFLLFQF